MKRGQAALEFLTTYGWAIIVVLAVIGGLAYYGPWNGQLFVSERCVFASEFTCVEHQFQQSAAGDDAHVDIQLKNSVGEYIDVTEIKVDFPNGQEDTLSSGNCAVSIGSEKWPPGDQREITCNLAGNNGGFLRGDKDRVKVHITYKIDEIDGVNDGFPHTVSGDLVAKVNEI